MKINQKSIYYIIIFIFCMLDLDCFYLVNSAEFSIFGVSYLDIVFLLHILFAVVIWIHSGGFLKLSTKKINLLFYCTVILACISAVVGTQTYGQSWMAGFVSQRQWVGCMLMFLPISRLLKTKQIDISGLKKILAAVCIVLVLVCALQYVLSDVITFTHGAVNERYEDVRYRFELAYLILMSGFAMDSLFEFKRNMKGFINVFIVLGTLLMCMVITKGRMATISFIIAAVFCVTIRKTKKMSKIYTIGALLVAMLAFFSTEIGRDILDLVFGVNMENNTMLVRDAGRVYYIDLWTENIYTIIFGCGSPNVHSATAMAITNPLWHSSGEARFYLSDNGIIQGIYIYGVLGIVWFVALLGYSFKNATYVYKTTNKIGYIMFPLVDIIACITLVPNLFQGLIVMPIYLAMLQAEVRKLKMESEYGTQVIGEEFSI